MSGYKSNYIARLEGRIEQLEKEVRLIHRKLRSVETDRADLIKGTLLEILNSNSMRLVFDDFNQHPSATDPLGDETDEEQTSTYKPVPRRNSGRNYSKAVLVKAKGAKRSIDSKTMTHRKTLCPSEVVAVVHDSMPSQFEEVDSALDVEYKPRIKKYRAMPKSKQAGIKLEENTNGDASETKEEESSSFYKFKNRIPKDRGMAPVRRNYVLAQSFNTPEECAVFMKSDVDSRIRSRKPAPGGERAFYNCKRELTCPFRKYVFYSYPENGGKVDLYRTTEDHNHPTLPFGIADEVRDQILSLVHSGSSDALVINDTLAEKGFPKVQISLLSNFMSTLSPTD